MNEDFMGKLIDFALTNEVIIEISLFLLGNEKPEHQVKWLSFKLNENYNEIIDDSNRKQDFDITIDEQLASAFKVSLHQIIINSFNEWSIEINFTIKDLDHASLSDMHSKMMNLFFL